MHLVFLVRCWASILRLGSVALRLEVLQMFGLLCVEKM